jgi:hypothetical protein
MSNFKIKGFNGKKGNAFAFGYIAVEGQPNSWVVRTPSGEFLVSPNQNHSGTSEFCNDLKNGVYGEVA